MTSSWWRHSSLLPLMLSAASVLLLATVSRAHPHAECADCNRDACEDCEVMDIEIAARSYDGSMWYCVDGQDRYFDRERYATEGMDYVNSLPAHERPAMRKLADGSEEPDILDFGDVWVCLTSPSTGARHNYLIASDGYHAVKTPIYLPSVEGIPGKDYLKKTPFKTVPTNHKRLEATGRTIAGDRKIDTFDAPYKGTDFVIDFLMAIVDEPTKAYLRESRLNWPKTMIHLDNYYRKKLGDKASAFIRHGIPMGDTPPRGELSQDSYITNPQGEGEVMDIEIGARSYDGSMWYCVDGENRYFDRERYAAEGMDYVNSLPENERPEMRKLVDGSEEPDILDFGDVWVAVKSPKHGHRYAYLLAGDGYHAVRTPMHLPVIENIPGRDYLKATSFKTVPTTHKELREIGKRIAGDRRIDTFDAPYKGTDFVIDFLMAIVDESTKNYLRESRLNWPKTVIHLDKYYINKLGEGASVFARHGIPMGDTPPREHMSHSSYIENPKGAPAARR